MLKEEEAIKLLKEAYKKGNNLEGIEVYLKYSLEDKPIQKELKRLDFTANKIVANGKVLTIAEKLSTKKYGEYEKLNNTFAFGKDIKAIHTDLKLCQDLFDKQKLTQVAVVLNNLDEGMVRMLENRIPSAFELCCLFMTYDNEDIAGYHPELNKQKWDDISAEGYAMEDFFTLACQLSLGYVDVYKDISRDISDRLNEASKVTDKLEEK